MEYFFDANEAEKNTTRLPPLNNTMTYPELYKGPVPILSDIETGYGKTTEGLMTIAGGGRSFGVLGEGNAHIEILDDGTRKSIDVDEMGMRLRKETGTTKHGCDDSYLMLSMVPTKDAELGADRLAVTVSSKEWYASLAPPKKPFFNSEGQGAIIIKGVFGSLMVLCVSSLVL